MERKKNDKDKKTSTTVTGLYYIVHSLLALRSWNRVSWMVTLIISFCLSCFCLVSHERQSRHRERRWRGGRSGRWSYNQTRNDSASSSVSRAVATTVAGTTLVVGTTGPIASSATSMPVRGHEACLLPCHGPCAASNQSSSCCKGAVNNAHSPTPSSLESRSHHREHHLILARNHVRVWMPPFSCFPQSTAHLSIFDVSLCCVFDFRKH